VLLLVEHTLLLSTDTHVTDLPSVYWYHVQAIPYAYLPWCSICSRPRYIRVNHHIVAQHLKLMMPAACQREEVVKKQSF
jgi:hypothetical protein